MSRLRTFTCDDEVVRIGCGLFARTLPKAEWTHAAHFASAVWVIMRRPEVDPLVVIAPAIRAYNESTGVPNTDTGGYHETITRASILAAAAFVASGDARPLYETCNALLSSSLGRSDWLLTYWKRERLFSLEARKAWVEPDRSDFPW